MMIPGARYDTRFPTFTKLHVHHARLPTCLSSICIFDMCVCRCLTRCPWRAAQAGAQGKCGIIADRGIVLFLTTPWRSKWDLVSSSKKSIIDLGGLVAASGMTTHPHIYRHAQHPMVPHNGLVIPHFQGSSIPELTPGFSSSVCFVQSPY